MAFKNTILGKILKGAAKVLPFVAGAAAFVIPGIGPAAGVGIIGKAAAGIAKTIKGSVGAQVVTGIVKTVGTVAKSAVNLVTGSTSAERAQVREVTAEAKDAQDILDQKDRLMRAGASETQANKMVGITAADLGSADAQAKDQEAAAKPPVTEERKAEITANLPPVTTAGQGCLILAVCLLSGLASIVSIILIF
jgi:hypothetical protein